MIRWNVGLTVLATMVAAAPSFAQQDYPNRPVRLVYPFPAGNVLDVAGRMIGDKFQQATGQPMIYDYKPGGSGIIAAETVKSARPDGYTVMFATSGMMTINPHTFASLPYDPFKDYDPIVMGVGSQLVFAGKETMPKTFAEFLAHAKANPGGKVSFASFTPGNPSHFAGVILNGLAGIDMTHVGYRGTPPATTDLVGGHVDTAFLPIQSLKQYIEQGKIKAYAITGGERSALLPGVPTFKELGYPKMEIYIWAAFLAPAGTPRPIIDRLNREFTAAMNKPDVLARLREVDLPPRPGTPEDLTKFMRTDSEKWAEAVKISGFKAE